MPTTSTTSTTSTPTTSTVPTTTTSSTTPTLTAGQEWVLLAFVVLGVLAAGGLVIYGRLKLSGKQHGGSTSLIRSWVAVALVLGLLIFAAFSLEIGDSTLRSTIFGGLVASVSAAVAYYFSSQGTAAAVQAAATLTQTPIAPTAFSAATPPAGTVGSTYTYSFVANGSPAPEYTLIQGPLPDGLTLTPNGTVAGEPATAQTLPVTIRAVNVAGFVDSPQIQLTMNPARAVDG